MKHVPPVPGGATTGHGRRRRWQPRGCIRWILVFLVVVMTYFLYNYVVLGGRSASVRFHGPWPWMSESHIETPPAEEDTEEATEDATEEVDPSPTVAPATLRPTYTLVPSFTPSVTPSATPTQTPSATPSTTPSVTPSATPTATEDTRMSIRQAAINAGWDKLHRYAYAYSVEVLVGPSIDAPYFIGRPSVGELARALGYESYQALMDWDASSREVATATAQAFKASSTVAPSTTPLPTSTPTRTPAPSATPIPAVTLISPTPKS